VSSGPQSTFKSKLASIPWPALWVVVVAQTTVHLALLRTGDWIGDTRLLQRWAGTLSSHPASSLYDLQKRADHLPGDLWILHLEAWVYRLVSGHSPSNDGFLNALKLGPAIADIGLAVILFLIARDVAGVRAGRGAALFFALNPAPYFISVVWGVADSVSMVFAALAIWLTVRGWFWAAVPVLTFACLIKPQLGLLAPLLLIFFTHEALRRDEPRRFVRPLTELAVAGIASIGVLLATLLPFGVGLPLMHERWSLIGRISFAADVFSNTTLNALNLWALLSSRSVTFPSINSPLDHLSGPFGLSYQHWGTLLTAIVCFVLALPLIRKGGSVRLIWTCATVTFAFFMLQTRIHERYFFPAITLMAIVVALRPRWLPLYIMMSSVYFANVWWVYHWLVRQQASVRHGRLVVPQVGGRLGLDGSRLSMVSDNLVRLASGVNLAVLAGFVIYALVDFFRTESKPVAAFAAVLDAPPASEWPSWPASLPG